MTTIKINAITVPDDGGDELARRFANRAGAVDGVEGFEGFELLRPTDDRATWLVVTRWRDEQSFRSWVSSPAFAEGHRSRSEHDAANPEPPGDGEEPRSAERGTVAMTSELWSYEPVDLQRS
jgi:heme-degrading monooxygenase HmoA